MHVNGHNDVNESMELAEPPSPAASIRDVAKVAGVSYQTVSRVINGHPSVRPATRTRVENAIRQTDFRPSAAARALSRGATDQVTILTSETSLYGYACTLAGIEHAARQAGVRVAIVVLESAEPRHVDAAVARVSDPRAGAVIVLAYDTAGWAALDALPPGVRRSAAVESRGIPRGASTAHQDWAWINETSAAQEATTFLLGLGHRTVEYIPIPSSIAAGPRQLGWRRALDEAGVTARTPPAMARWDVRTAYSYTRDLLLDGTTTALLCGNDDFAVAAMRAVHDLGLAVPHDVSVIGFDDIPLAPYLVPSLTTVRLDFDAVGRRAFGVLYPDASESNGDAVVPTPLLVVRGSTAPPHT